MAESRVVGIGSHPSTGLKKAWSWTIESTVQSIQRAVEEAELMGGCRIGLRLRRHCGQPCAEPELARKRRHQRQRSAAQDVDRVIDAAGAVAIPADQKVLHVLTQEYVIDSQEGVREPLGMSGVRMEAKVHLVSCAVNAPRT